MPDGTGYAKLLDFAGATNGSYPWGSLISDGTFLYGMTQQGGTPNVGTVFKYNPYCAAITDSVTIVPATCGSNNGSASVTPSGGAGTYTFLWSNGNTTSTVTGLSGQPADTLIVTITDSIGCTLTDTAIVSCVTGIAENNEEADFAVYPNPTNGKITVAVARGVINSIVIYNVLGEKIYSLQEGISGKKEIDLGIQSPGFYYLKAITEKGTACKKIVIN